MGNTSGDLKMAEPVFMPIECIRPNEWNPNVMTEEEYKKLKTSIELTKGVYLTDNPIMVRPIDDESYAFEIIDGEHRWNAAVDLGYPSICVNVREGLDEEAAMELCVVLNKDRGQINYFKLSKLLTNAYEAYSHDLNQEELGRRFGYSQPTMALILPVYERLESIDASILSGFSNRELTFLARVRNNDLRQALVNYASERKISSDTIQKLASNMNTVSKYGVTEALNNEVLKKDYGAITEKELEKANDFCRELVNRLGANIFTYSVKLLKEEINSIIQQLGKTDLVLLTEMGYPPIPWDVWNYTRDEKYGLEYPGSIPAGIIFNTLYFYTDQGDLVVDPMAGGGVVGDVCEAINRECWMFDIKPCRDDIIPHDLTNKFPAKNADLVFLDPPYFKKMEKEYGEKSISALEREDYLAFFDKLAAEIWDSGSKRVALLMSDYTDDEDPEKHIFIWEYVNRFASQGWIPERHVMAPLSTSAIHPDFVEKFRNSKKLGRLGRSLVIFRRPAPR